MGPLLDQVCKSRAAAKTLQGSWDKRHISQITLMNCLKDPPDFLKVTLCTK